MAVAVNKPVGDNARKGAVSDRTQFEHNGTWFKRDTGTGRIMDSKQDGTPFKGVAKEPDRRRK